MYIFYLPVDFRCVLQVIHSKVEDVKLDLKIDIMVSEWMGFYLLHESMLDSVIYARNKFLKPDGLMFPKSAQIFASPCKIPELWKNCHDFWNEKQYGFDLSCFSDVAKIKNKPEIVSVNYIHINLNYVALKTIYGFYLVFR